jgi:phosphoribosylamine--glycine ligase
MGAYAPVSLATEAVMADARERVFLPTLRALAQRGCPFQGVLYAGLMLTAEGQKVVEFNCRFGDPETQAILPLMESSLLELLVAAAEGTGLRGRAPSWRAGAALTTVVASGGYPGSYEKGRTVTIPYELESSGETLLFHAGTTSTESGVVTSGGRVLAATGLGSTLSEAAATSRRAAEAVAFEGRQFRSDIGWRELARV